MRRRTRGATTGRRSSTLYESHGSMKLSSDEVARFYNLNTALLVDVNRHLLVVPGVDTEEAWSRASFRDKVDLRNALYDHPDLIDRFVAENPRGFTAEELAEIASWRSFLRGTFYIVRFLKRYAVFLDTETPPRAYGVLGLHDSIEHLVGFLRPPIYVKAVLLPFQGRIVYDGVLEPAQIYFGPGLRASLNETYQAIQENQGITESLVVPGRSEVVAGTLPSTSPEKRRRTSGLPALLPALERVEQDTDRLRGAETVLERRALTALRAAASLARTVAAEPDNPEGIARARRRLRTAVSQLETSFNRRQLDE